MTLVLEAQSGEGNVVSRMLLSYHVFSLSLLVLLTGRGESPLPGSCSVSWCFGQGLPVMGFVVSSVLGS